MPAGKESSYCQYWDANNLYEWAISQKLSVNNFKLVKNISRFDNRFIKSYDEKSDDRYFLEVDVQYSEKLLDLHIDLPFLPEKMKIEKVEKLVANYVMHIRNLKQALSHGLVLKKVHRVIRFN